MPRQGTGMQREQSRACRQILLSRLGWRDARLQRWADPSETSTWPAARAGSGDVTLAPLRRCPRCLWAQRCPNRPTQPSRVIRCQFLLIVQSLSHPARCEDTASIPRAGKQAIPPAAQRQGQQMPAGMSQLLPQARCPGRTLMCSAWYT